MTFPACADNIFILLGVRKNRTSPNRLDFHMPSSGTVLTTDSMAKSDWSAAHQKVARPLCTWSASKRHNPPCLPVFADSPSVVTPTSFVSLPPVRSKALFTASSSQGAPFFSGECMTTNTLVVAAMCGSEVIIMVNDPFQHITTVRPYAACDCYSAIFRTFLCHLLILLTCCA